MSRNAKRDEGGAILVLALVFVIATGLVGIALASLATTNVMATKGFQTKRGTEFAVDGAVDAAIQQMRYSTNTVSSTTLCFTAGQGGTINNTTVFVYCSPGGPPPANYQRSINFQACAVANATCPNSQQELTATVNFADYYHGVPELGASLQIASWSNTT